MLLCLKESGLGICLQCGFKASWASPGLSAASWDVCSSCCQARAQLSALWHQRLPRACGPGCLDKYQAPPPCPTPLVTQHVGRPSCAISRLV